MICYRCCCCFYHRHRLWSATGADVAFITDIVQCLSGSAVVVIIDTVICHRFCCLHQHILNVGTQHKAIIWGRKNDGMDAEPRMGSHGSWWWDWFFRFYCYSCLYHIYVTFTEIKVFFGRQARFSGSSSSLFVLDLITNIWSKPLLSTLVLECLFSAVQRLADFILHKLQFSGMACIVREIMPCHRAQQLNYSNEKLIISQRIRVKYIQCLCRHSMEQRNRQWFCASDCVKGFSLAL